MFYLTYIHKKMTFGKTLRRIRRIKDLSQRELAQKIPMDVTYLSRLETDGLESMPTKETIAKIAKALECTDTELGELLSSAGRITAEIESLSEIAKEKPLVGKLFRAAARLSPEKLEELISRFESETENSDKMGEK